jgi:hypothetical protein
LPTGAPATRIFFADANVDNTLLVTATLEQIRELISHPRA